MTAKRARKSEPRTRRVQSGKAEAGSTSLETVANEISARIRDVHMKHGSLMDPIFASPESEDIISYTHTGDSPIWTGHFLAAEAFRHRVTGSEAALDNVKAALSGLKDLVDITGYDILARIAVPSDSPYAEAIKKEEGASHGVFPGRLRNADSFWIGNTTRDQYYGAMFGLGVALELVPDADVQRDLKSLISRLVGYLDGHHWTIKMPNDKISTTMLQRPDQQLAFLQVARQASGDFGSRYRKAALTLSAVASLPIIYDNLDDHHSYFKFNLNSINLYSLLRFENPRSLARAVYLRAYNKLRQVTQTHQNAFFNMIDHAIKGPNRQRDQETVSLLNAWLQRPRRDPFVDLRGQVPAAGDDRARDVIPVPMRPNTDFLWQRSPFLLYGGGVGLVEGAGIDFTLPYWMGRHFGVIES